MTSITISLPEDRLAKLREIAARLNVTPEDLARVGIEELLTRPDETFKQAAEYVLRKNSELYRRLA
jgi:predicted transcriptional regulator